MRQKRGKKSAGVTLVELMIAMMVMAIAILCIVSVMLHTIKAKEITREFDIARDAAAAKLESMRALKWAETDINDTGPYLSDLTSSIYQNWSIPQLNHTTTADKKGFGSIVLHNQGTSDFNANLLDVEVTIEWVGIDGVRKHSVRSMFTR